MAGEAVLQLEGGGDQVAPRVSGDPEGGGELGDAELRDQGCPGSGERDSGLGAAAEPGCGPGRGQVDRLHGVLLGPDDRGDQDVRLGGVGDGALVAGEGEHVTRSVELLESGRFPCLHGESQPATTDKNPSRTDLFDRMLDTTSSGWLVQGFDELDQRRSRLLCGVRTVVSRRSLRSLLNHRGGLTVPPHSRGSSSDGDGLGVLAGADALAVGLVGVVHDEGVRRRVGR